MGTIKLKRGTGSPAGSLEQYEVAMDVAAKKLYVSTNGTDAVVLANEYADADAVTAIEDASGLTLSGSLTTESGLTNNANSYGTVIFAKRDDNENTDGDLPHAILQRDLGTETVDAGFDARGLALEYNLISDDGNKTQYLGGLAMQSGSDDESIGHWLRAYSRDDAYGSENIFHANKDEMYVYGTLRAQNELVVSNLSEFNDTVTIDATLEAKGEIQLHEGTSKLSVDSADLVEVYDTEIKFTGTNFGNIAVIEREESVATGASRLSGYTQVNYVDGNRDLIDPGDNSGASFAFGVNRSQFAQVSAKLDTATVKTDGSNEIDYVNSESRIEFGVYTGDPLGNGQIALTSALMIEPHINQVTMNSIDGGTTSFGTDGDGLAFQAKNLTFNIEEDSGTFNDIDFNIDGDNKLVVLEDELRADVPFRLPSHTVANLPTSNISAGAMAFCTNDVGGSITVFWDGADWRRTTDRAVAST